MSDVGVQIVTERQTRERSRRGHRS